MKARLFLFTFIALGSFWMMVFSTYNSQETFVLIPYLGAPLASVAMGLLQGFLIVALGLRMFVNIRYRNDMAEIASIPLRVTINGNDPLVPCQVGHREPYLAKF